MKLGALFLLPLHRIGAMVILKMVDKVDKVDKVDPYFLAIEDLAKSLRYERSNPPPAPQGAQLSAAERQVIKKVVLS